MKNLRLVSHQQRKATLSNPREMPQSHLTRKARKASSQRKPKEAKANKRRLRAKQTLKLRAKASRLISSRSLGLRRNCPKLSQVKVANK